MLRTTRFATVIGTSMLAACAAGNYDVGKTDGVPSVQSILMRIKCELVDLVKSDAGPQDPANWAPFDYRLSFLTKHYVVVTDLDLSITQSGTLAPTVSYTSNPMFGIAGGLKYSRSRTDQFSQRYSFVLDELIDTWNKDHSLYQCPLHDTNLAGELGIRKTATLGIPPAEAVPNDDKELFGGSITFDVARNVKSFGPTWTLTHLVFPGGLLTLESENKDVLTISFSEVADPGNAASLADATARAEHFLDTLTIKRLANALSTH